MGIAGITIVPSYAISGLGHINPSDKLHVAGIGVGSKGAVNLNNIVGQNIVALCDVDWQYAGPVFERYPEAKRWKDFREMLEKQKDIDAVVIATPDHTHAVQAMMAMQLGKHVYVQKPLTHSVWEARALTEAARKYKVATQMGNEGHSRDEVRVVTELIRGGVIGDVYEVYVTTDRPIWPQGLERPTESHEAPDYLDWDLFLGPAPYRPYHEEAYHPWSWRAWWDFGTGALGDMGCHVMDVPFYALQLKYPTRVIASSTVVNTESAPQASRVEYTFPERVVQGKRFPELMLVWSDGGIMPSRIKELPAGEPMGSPGGMNLFVGTKGKIVSSSYGSDYKVFLNDGSTYEVPPETIDRVTPSPLGGGLHEMDWVRACKEEQSSRKEATSHFDYSGPLTETVLMGNLAIRLQALERTLEWDGEKMEITNIGDHETVKLITSHRYEKVNMRPRFNTTFQEVNALAFTREMIKHTYRNGWGW